MCSPQTVRWSSKNLFFVFLLVGSVGKGRLEGTAGSMRLGGFFSGTLCRFMGVGLASGCCCWGFCLALDFERLELSLEAERPSFPLADEALLGQAHRGVSVEVPHFEPSFDLADASDCLDFADDFGDDLPDDLADDFESWANGDLMFGGKYFSQLMHIGESRLVEVVDDTFMRLAR